jgi:hypothetical protein
MRRRLTKEERDAMAAAFDLARQAMIEYAKDLGGKEGRRDAKRLLILRRRLRDLAREIAAAKTVWLDPE